MVTTTYSSSGVRIVDYTADEALIHQLKNDWQNYIQTIPPYPGNFEGRGIVICAGGIKYFTCAWVNISVLRSLGCTLPIEVWYGENELTSDAIEALSTLQVVCKNVKDYTDKSLIGYALKPFAILNSAFKEVLYLDADNNCTVDPAGLFEWEQYEQTGAVFWPDFWTTDINNSIWQIIPAGNTTSSEQESGQILINKEKCWKALNLCMYFNLNSQYYYKMLLGDKDTFRFAWTALEAPFHMISYPVGYGGYYNPQKQCFYGLSMIQHDTTGNVLFLHRNLLKWDMTSPDEVLWKEIKRFSPLSKTRIFSSKFIDTGDGKGFNAYDIAGDVETLGFTDILGDYELRCLDVLKRLRNEPFYCRFLVHTYHLFFKPGYATAQVL